MRKRASNTESDTNYCMRAIRMQWLYTMTANTTWGGQLDAIIVNFAFQSMVLSDAMHCNCMVLFILWWPRRSNGADWPAEQGWPTSLLLPFNEARIRYRLRLNMHWIQKYGSRTQFVSDSTLLNKDQCYRDEWVWRALFLVCWNKRAPPNNGLFLLLLLLFLRSLSRASNWLKRKIIDRIWLTCVCGVWTFAWYPVPCCL